MSFIHTLCFYLSWLSRAWLCCSLGFWNYVAPYAVCVLTKIYRRPNTWTPGSLKPFCSLNSDRIPLLLSLRSRLDTFVQVVQHSYSPARERHDRVTTRCTSRLTSSALSGAAFFDRNLLRMNAEMLYQALDQHVFCSRGTETRLEFCFKGLQLLWKLFLCHHHYFGFDFWVDGVTAPSLLVVRIYTFILRSSVVQVSVLVWWPRACQKHTDDQLEGQVGQGRNLLYIYEVRSVTSWFQWQSRSASCLDSD